MEETLLSLKEAVDSNECPHPGFVNNNACVLCKKPKNKCNDPITLQFWYIHRNLFLTVEGIRLLRDLNLKQLLQRKKLHLVLDLDNTLIHCNDLEKKDTKNNNQKNEKKNGKSSPNNVKAAGDDIYEIIKGAALIKLRPGTRDFLEKASEIFELSIYTMGDKEYAGEIAKILETDKVRFSRVIYRDNCSMKASKGLKVVLSHPRLVLIVDDLDEVWCAEDRGNVIKIKPYTFFDKKGTRDDDDDQELVRVLGVLKAVHTKFYDKKEGNYHANKDVRQLLKKVNYNTNG
ncbi:RNA polymerase II C-terminal domain phosphatase-like 4 [Silene latifolia]|uniref:RNA polymerase II C-terminal domain phosphatase-like 4 n=1 Tax=Silene latifolia TaxID=37657 RepID=UPI003D776C47